MQTSSLVVSALLRAIGVVGYIALLATGVTFGIIGQGPDEGILKIVSGMTLIVFSALVTSLTVFLTPVRLYLDGQKTDGVKLLLYTVIWLGVLLTLILTTRALVQ